MDLGRLHLRYLLKFNIFKNQLTCSSLEDNLLKDEDDHLQFPAVIAILGNK